MGNENILQMIADQLKRIADNLEELSLEKKPRKETDVDNKPELSKRTEVKDKDTKEVIGTTGRTE